MKDEELQRLIKAITQEVQKRLEKKAVVASEDNSSEQEANLEQKPKLLLVFTGGGGDLDTVLQELEDVGRKYMCYVIFTKAGQKVIGAYKLKEKITFEEISQDLLHQTIAEVSAVIFPTLTQNTAAKAVCGIRDSIGSEAMACSLLTKKRVLAVTNSIPLHDIPPTYGSLCGDILKRLSHLGVQLCEAQQLGQNILNLKGKDTLKFNCSQEQFTQKEEAEEKPEPVVREKILVKEDKKLITVDVISQAKVDGYSELKLAPRTIVTPLAADAAKEQNIKISWMVK